MTTSVSRAKRRFESIGGSSLGGGGATFRNRPDAQAACSLDGATVGSSLSDRLVDGGADFAVVRFKGCSRVRLEGSPSRFETACPALQLGGIGARMSPAN